MARAPPGSPSPLARAAPGGCRPRRKHDTEDVALCFHRLTLSTVTGAVAPSHDDAEALRTAALQQSGLTLPQCPPARTVILLRSDKEPRRYGRSVHRRASVA